MVVIALDSVFMHIFVTLYKIIKENLCLFLSKAYYSLKNKDLNIWVFGEWFGNRCCDNCLFFANYIAMHYPDKKIFWIANEGTDLSHLNNSIARLVMDTKDAIIILKKAGVVIYNQDRRDITLKPYIYYGGALTVNLWHGVPWKHIGLDITKASHSISSRTVLYTKLQYFLWGADLYLSLSSQFSRILEGAYIRGDKSIIQSGYPRNMLFYNNDSLIECRNKLKAYLLKKYAFTMDDTIRVIAYMPTFRDNVENVFSFLSIENEDLLLKLAQWNVVIVEKSHYVTAGRTKESRSGFGRVYSIDADFMSQQLLAASDMLITDYSSCFFDFLLLDRPIIHYLYDYDYYSSEDRGLYYDKEDVVCGDVAYDVDQLFSIIKSNLSNPQRNHTLRENRKKQFMEYESPNSCQEIFQLINGYLCK